MADTWVKYREMPENGETFTEVIVNNQNAAVCLANHTSTINGTTRKNGEKDSFKGEMASDNGTFNWIQG